MPSDRDLERELRDLGAHVEYPPTPDLARAVASRLDHEGTRRAARSRKILPSLPSSRWAAATAALVLIVAVPVLSPAMRATVTGWFEAGGVASSGQAADGASRVESKGDTEAPSAAQGEPAPGSGRRYLGEGLGFGERVTLGEARSMTRAPLLLPRAAGLGGPDEVYAGEHPEDGVTLVYRARQELPSLGDTGIGLVLTERVGGVQTSYLQTEALPDSGLERVEVGGKPGYWAPAGRDAPRSGQLGGSVLLWEQGGRALRLEADLSEEEAIRVAESVR